MERFRSYCMAAGLLAWISVFVSPAAGDEFVGPFPSWANVKTEYGAVGDGKADDTAAIQSFNNCRSPCL